MFLTLTFTSEHRLRFRFRNTLLPLETQNLTSPPAYINMSTQDYTSMPWAARAFDTPSASKSASLIVLSADQTGSIQTSLHSYLY